MEHAIPIFEKTHPGAIAVFAFDNSSAHASLAKDALDVNNMNLSDGGKQPLKRNTLFNGQVQNLVHSNGQAKGIRTILFKIYSITWNKR